MENGSQQNPPGFCGSYKWEAMIGLLKGLSKSTSFSDKWDDLYFFVCLFNHHVNLFNVWILDHMLGVLWVLLTAFEFFQPHIKGRQELTGVSVHVGTHNMKLLSFRWS